MIPVQSSGLKPYARQVSRLIRRLGANVQSTLIRHREEVLERQLVHERLAWTAMEIYAAACTMSRWDLELSRTDHSHDAVAKLLIADSLRRAETHLHAMRSNDDQQLRNAARAT